jgi:hypothetical protein
MKDLPYDLYVSVLLKDESYIDKADKSGIEGYSFITSKPIMVMLFVEYEEGKYSEINKKIWNMVQYDYKSIEEGKKWQKKKKNSIEEAKVRTPAS